MELNRRRYLVVAGATVGSGLAGCSSIPGGGGGPEYESDQKEEMLLSVDAFPDGWVRNDEMNENFDAGFTNEDESVLVLIKVEIFDEISEAKDRMETARAGVSDPNDYPIADDAFWATQNDEFAATLFRHSNGVGQSAAVRESGREVVPDQQRSQEYAETMYEHWQDL